MFYFYSAGMAYTFFFKHPFVRGVPPSRAQQTMVEQRAKELEDLWCMLRPGV